ncbi:MAG: exodeoxyribonuclease VII small subunit [Roseococcus sp.]|nr:exodeoxyribonuclease VII small subunit [Roseococcus sp.]
MSVQPSSAPGGAAAREIASLSFEEALGELEAIVKVLESGSVTLAQAIETYERGTALRRYCEAKLSEAEAKVRAVVEGGNGLSVRAVE